jgi:hypothetical protein
LPSLNIVTLLENLIGARRRRKTRLELATAAKRYGRIAAVALFANRRLEEIAGFEEVLIAESADIVAAGTLDRGFPAYAGVDDVPDAVPRADAPDVGDAVVRAPGVAAAWSMDSSVSSGFAAVEKNMLISCLAGNIGPGSSTLSVDDVLVVVPRADTPDVGDSVTLDHDFPAYVKLSTGKNYTTVSFYSIDEVPDSVEDVSDAVEDDVPDVVDEVVDCPSCRTLHAGGVFSEVCRQAHRNAHRCARCGLLHEDYDLVAQVLHDMKNFDCQFYVPVV